MTLYVYIVCIYIYTYIDNTYYHINLLISYLSNILPWDWNYVTIFFSFANSQLLRSIAARDSLIMVFS